MNTLKPKNLNQGYTWLSFLSLCLFIFGGVVTIAPIVGAALTLPFVGFDFSQLELVMSMPTNKPELRTAILVFHGGNALGYSIIAPWLYLRFVRKQKVWDYLEEASDISSSGVILSLSIALVSIYYISPITSWNEKVNFSEQLPSLYNWMRGQEDRIRELTEFITDFDTFSEFLVALIVIGGIAAVGEEFLFRGLIQKHLVVLTKNHHVGIIISAFIFSAIHLQFFGFFPRFILGLTFGYMYHYGKSLAYPIAAHFFNNGFVVVSFYLYKQGWISLDPNNNDVTPLWLSGLACIAFLICFTSYIKIFENREKR